MRKPVILISDDDRMYCDLMQSLISKAGYTVFTANDLESCIRILDKEKIDLLLQDMAFPVISNGFDALEYAHEKHPEVTVVMVSGEGHIQDAVRALKCGAVDFLEKGGATEQILAKIAWTEHQLNLEEQNTILAIKAMNMIGKSPAIKKVYDQIIKAARFDTPVLITGETGVGKELAANAIHRLSKFSDKNMITVNCGAIPDELVESAFFGHEAGAFTHAIKAQRGYFEQADGSSIFLNEIGELPLGVQAALLRVLSEGEIQKVGGKVMKVKTRLICDTNINIQEYIEKKLFREDLYYRISTITINIPPLRERVEDIPALAEYFMNCICAANDMIPKPISPQAMTWLMQQPWKGNVRELCHVIERGVINAMNDHITVADLHSPCCGLNYDIEQHGKTTLRKSLLEYEKTLITNALSQHNWNKTQAAQALGIDKSNLIKKIKDLQISQPE